MDILNEQNTPRDPMPLDKESDPHRERLKLARVAGISEGTERLPDEVIRAVVSIATSAWRIGGKVSDDDGESRKEIGSDDLRKVHRYLESIRESLSSIGIEIKDRTGEAYDYGLPERVVATQPQPGLTKGRVVETLRPTIFWRSQIVQQGEVVISTPVDSQGGQQ